MFSSEIRRMPRPQEVARMTTAELREAFLVPAIQQTGGQHGLFTDLDRMVVAMAVPTNTPLELPNHKETGRAFFLERRELGAINTGGSGEVTVDGKTFSVEPLGCIYVGMGSQKFTSPARMRVIRRSSSS